MIVRQSAVGFCLLMLASCAAPPSATPPAVPIEPQPIATTFDPDHTPGPTVMAKVAEGYELTNTLLRVVINDQTGDVIFWGYKQGVASESRNMVFQRGIYATLAGLPDVPAHGYIEKRDEQTWQFYGEDDNHIIWRKIYCLEGDSLFVSTIILNNRPAPLDTAIQISGDLISLNIQHHDPEQFTGAGGYGQVSLHGYNVLHAPTSQPSLPVLLQSDSIHLKPQERQGYTSQWKLLPS